MNNIYRVNVQDSTTGITDEMFIVDDNIESAESHALNGSIMEFEEESNFDFHIVSSEYVGELQV